MKLFRSPLPAVVCLVLTGAFSAYSQGPDLLAWGQSPSLDNFSNHLAPTVPSPQHAVDKMLEVANLKPGETLFDLGCGDGRILAAAAKRYGVHAVGIEISASYAKKAVERARHDGVQDHVKVIHGDFMKEDLSAANVVMLYLATAANEKLRPNLERELKPNTRVVSYDYAIPGWKAIDTFDTEGHLGDSHVIYLYQVPASINKK